MKNCGRSRRWCITNRRHWRRGRMSKFNSAIWNIIRSMLISVNKLITLRNTLVDCAVFVPSCSWMLIVGQMLFFLVNNLRRIIVAIEISGKMICSDIVVMLLRIRLSTRTRTVPGRATWSRRGWHCPWYRIKMCLYCGCFFHGIYHGRICLCRWST